MKPLTSVVRKAPVALATAVSATLLTSLAAPPPASAATQATYYVAPGGDDANPGTITAPFKTLQHARDVVRTVDSNMTGDINVFLRGGTYPVSRTVDFTSADSGTNGHRVVYAAYPGEKPVLDGGVQVTGWTQHSGNIWKATLDRDDKLRALYVNDKRARMASKTINTTGCYGTYTVTAGQAPWAWESGSQCDGAKYGLSDLPAVASDQDDVEIVSATTWTTAIVGVRQITTSPDGANRVALFQQPGAAIAQAPPYGPFKASGSHAFMNAYEFLDQPGEFYFNKTTHTLYYYKSGSEDMTSAKVFAPNNLSTLLKIAGTSTTDHARNITFSGLTVEHSDWNLVNVAGSVFRQGTQGNASSTVYARQNFHAYTYRNVDLPPAAVQIENADGIVLQGNTVQHTGADGITLADDVTDSQLTGNVTNDIAGSAITVGHPQHVYIGDYTSTNHEKYPVNVEGICKNISITDNYLYDSAVSFQGSSPVSAYFVDSLSVQHNRIEKSPWAGITLGWGWWNFDGSTNSINPGNPTSTAKNNTIKYNQILDTMQVLGDSAPIYTLGSQPGTEISGNYIKGVPAGHKYGLHPDEGSAFINEHDNVFDVDPGLAYTINSGTWGRQHDLTITNNYGTVNKIAGRNVPNSTIQDVRGHGDNVWPSQAYAIALNAGLEDAYKNLVPQSRAAALQDYTLPASTFAGTGVTTIPMRSPQDATKTLWLAPAGTATFAAGPTMTSASGTSTSIRVPQTAGDYRLYVVDARGNVSAASNALVRQRWNHVDDKAAGVTYSGTWSNWNDTRDVNGSEKVASTAGNYAEFSFTGSGVRYLSMTQPNMGKVDVYIDGTLTRAGIDAYAPTVTKQVPLFEKTDLAAGPHTIRVVCTGTKNTASSATVCAVDAFASIRFPATNANYKMVNKNSSKAVDVSGGSLSAGANVIQWTDSGAGNQNWRFVPVGDGSYKVVSRNSALVMDVSGASTADGASVIQSSDTNAANQHWTLVATGDGYYKIKNVNSNKVLDVSSGGAQLVQATDTNADSQVWRVVNVD
ncbi:RICIN domain-containing protein [Kitasatospora sp. NPDC051914]|uniref:RICIN domain-containing protein n=1 Tax=Kitasatospora sp. NPDC051914 TaxID=3154945 RepID=UPI0034411E05